MVKINLQVVMLLLLSFIVILYMVDLWIPIFWVSVLKSIAYFFFASTIVAQAFGAIFGEEETKKRKK